MVVHAEEISGTITEKEKVKEDEVTEEKEIIIFEEAQESLSEEFLPYNNDAGDNDEILTEDTSEDLDDVPSDVLECSPGWNDKDGDWYYANQSGQFLTGWQLIDGVWYYLDGTNSEKPGVMLSDQKKVIDSRTFTQWSGRRNANRLGSEAGGVVLCQ